MKDACIGQVVIRVQNWSFKWSFCSAYESLCRVQSNVGSNHFENCRVVYFQEISRERPKSTRLQHKQFKKQILESLYECLSSLNTVHYLEFIDKFTIIVKIGSSPILRHLTQFLLG